MSHERGDIPPGAADWKAPVGEPVEEPKKVEESETKESPATTSPTIEQYQTSLKLRQQNRENTIQQFDRVRRKGENVVDANRTLDYETIGIAEDMDKKRLAAVPLVELEEDPAGYASYSSFGGETVSAPGLAERFKKGSLGRVEEVMGAKRSPERIVQELTYDLSVIEEKITDYTQELKRLKQIVDRDSEDIDARLRMEAIQNKNLPRQEELRKKVLERISKETKGSTKAE